MILGLFACLKFLTPSATACRSLISASNPFFSRYIQLVHIWCIPFRFSQSVRRGILGYLLLCLELDVIVDPFFFHRHSWFGFGSEDLNPFMYVQF